MCSFLFLGYSSVMYKSLTLDLQVIDGRKVVGKIEVKIRLREPVLTKQITQKKEKWLSIDRA